MTWKIWRNCSACPEERIVSRTRFSIIWGQAGLSAEKHGITAMQVLLAFTLLKGNVAPIPKSGRKEHVLENLEAADVVLDEEDILRLDRAFPAPARRTYLDIV